jgi:hypothetical protein
VEESTRKRSTILGFLFCAVIAAYATFSEFWQTKNWGDFENGGSLAVRVQPVALACGRNYSPAPGCRAQISDVLVRLSSAPAPSRWVDLLHTLRFLGTTAEISGANGEWTGQELLSFVVDSGKTTERFGAVHFANMHGIIFLCWDPRQQDQGEPHRDQMLTVLGKVGIPNTQEIDVDGVKYTVADVVRAAQAGFGWDQELAFTALALAYYLPPGNTWTNKYGQRISFDAICDRLCALPMGNGACYGTHNLDALAALLAADSQNRILSSKVRGRARSVLKQAIGLLEKSQSSEGWWNRKWFHEKVSSENETGNELSTLVVTSHTLEWLATAPEDIECSPHRIERAIKYLTARTLAERPARLEQLYGVYTHVGTALQAWVPEVWRELSGEDCL